MGWVGVGTVWWFGAAALLDCGVRSCRSQAPMYGAPMMGGGYGHHHYHHHKGMPLWRAFTLGAPMALDVPCVPSRIQGIQVQVLSAWHVAVSVCQDERGAVRAHSLDSESKPNLNVAALSRAPGASVHTLPVPGCRPSGMRIPSTRFPQDRREGPGRAARGGDTTVAAPRWHLRLRLRLHSNRPLAPRRRATSAPGGGAVSCPSTGGSGPSVGRRRNMRRGHWHFSWLMNSSSLMIPAILRSCWAIQWRVTGHRSVSS
jgi:hypothetical protein